MRSRLAYFTGWVLSILVQKAGWRIQLAGKQLIPVVGDDL